MSNDTQTQTKVASSRKLKSRWRIVTEVLLVGIFIFGIFFQTGTGSASATGIYQVFSLCPIGAVTTFLASKTVIPAQIYGLLIFVVFAILFGKAFCSWVCPTQLWFKIFDRLDNGDRKLNKVNRIQQEKELQANSVDINSMHSHNTSIKLAASLAPAPKNAFEKGYLSVMEAPKPLRGSIHDSTNWVLFSILIAAFLLSFPLFCILCPVGLTFASLVSVINFFRFNTFSWGVVLFPLILLFEILVLPRWCHTLCPISAVLSWLSRFNFTFKPVVENNCLITQGKHCPKYCTKVCPEEIDFHDAEASAPMHQCTKCHLCADACPVNSIKFPFLPKKEDSINNSVTRQDSVTD